MGGQWNFAFIQETGRLLLRKEMLFLKITIFILKLTNLKDIECKLILKNVPSENNPAIMDLIVRYEFPEEMPIKTIKLVYNVLMKICRFMTNRENVGFDEVRLYQLDDETGNSFIEMFDYGILQDAGKVSAEIAKIHAETEFEKYRVIQDRLFMSDFDKYMLELEENVKK